MTDDRTASRRAFLVAAAGLASGGSRPPPAGAAPPEELPPGKPVPAAPAKFRLACMTLPYADFPLDRALAGVARAGFRHVAWGVTHRESDGQRVPVLHPDAEPAKARALARRCRDLGLEPVVMFAAVAPESDGAVFALRNRVLQAEAAGVAHVLTFGRTEGGGRKLWVERLRQLGPFARGRGVTVVLKPHGGAAGTGAALAAITREVADEGAKVCYDAGSVLGARDIDPVVDLKACADEVRAFCVTDRRTYPRAEDCGPGFGEIDHYKLLLPVAFSGREMPLCCETVVPPLLPRPRTPDEVDVLARRAREFLETVVAGLRAVR